MSKIIAFSGGCYSGKTTTIQALKKELETRGHKVVVLKESIRDILDTFNTDIDKARSMPNFYMSVQNNIIRKKMTLAEKAIADKSDTIYLEDRWLTDSLFYLHEYVEKYKLLRKGSTNEFFKLHEDIIKFLTANAKYYKLILEFSPLKLSKSTLENDVYRPNNLASGAQKVEYDMIHIYNKYFEHDNLIEIDAYKFDLNIDKIINRIGL